MARLTYVPAAGRSALLDEFHMAIHLKSYDYAYSTARHESVNVAAVVRVFSIEEDPE